MAIALPSDFRRIKCSAAVRGCGSQRDELDVGAVADRDGVFTSCVACLMKTHFAAERCGDALGEKFG